MPGTLATPSLCGGHTHTLLRHKAMHALTNIKQKWLQTWYMYRACRVMLIMLCRMPASACQVDSAIRPTQDL